MAHAENSSTSDDAHGDVPVNDPDGQVKPGGLGKDDTIPADPDGVAAGLTDSPSHFNPEEDEAADETD